MRLPSALSCYLATLFVPLALAAFAGPADAAPPGEPKPMQRRLQVGIDYLRQAGVQFGAETGRGRLAQTLSLNVVLHSDGVPMPNNPLDPEDSRRQYERAQRTQQRVQGALAKQGQQGRIAAAPSPGDMQAMQARAMQMQVRCGTDRDCLMREAMAMSAAQTANGDRNVQARLQAYGSAVQACERQAVGAAREACIATARRQHGGGDDDGPADEVVETPYLFFRGLPGCQLEIAGKIDDRVEGSFGDVQGTVPYTETVQAEQRRRDDTACPMVQAVLDTRSGRLWAYIGVAMREIAGVSVRSEKGRAPQRHEGQYGWRWLEADTWINQRLNKLEAAGGSDAVRLPAGAAGRSDGQVEVKLRWKFDPA